MDKYHPRGETLQGGGGEVREHGGVIRGKGMLLWGEGVERGEVKEVLR